MKTKVVRIRSSLELPKRPGRMHGAALAEWDRVASALFSMGRLRRHEGMSLELYCCEVARLAEIHAALEECKREGQVLRGGKTILKAFQRGCRDTALSYGFRVGPDGRMDLTRPVPLRTKLDEIERRIGRECKRLNLPTWLRPATTLSVRARREFYRVVALPNVHRRLEKTRDTALVNQYASAFDSWLDYRQQQKNVEKIGDTGIRNSVKNAVKHYQDAMRQMARELGLFVTTR